MTIHSDLIGMGVDWIDRQGYDIVLAEPWTSTGERPDVIGWKRNGAESILIEAKASRRDFQKEWSLTDRDKKTFRREKGAGAKRYYLAATPFVIRAQDLEGTGWGLLIISLGRIVVCQESSLFEVNTRTELEILVRAVADPNYGKLRPAQVSFRF